MLPPLPPLRDIVAGYNIAPDKKLGQNFLFDLNLTDRIVRLAGDVTNVTVIEIGPGPGGLTRSLLNAGAKKIIAIEHDPRCANGLKDYLVPAAEGRLEIMEADALRIDIRQLADGPIKLVANLPYNIGTLLLFNWLEYIDRFESLTLMFQKEVAERIYAVPRTKDYGRVSVMAQWLCNVQAGFDIPPQAFTPPPKVTSSVIHITPRPQPLVDVERRGLERLCKAVFGQRRKMLRKSLQQLTQQAEAVLAEAGIAPERRPEELTVPELCAIVTALAHHS